MKNITTSMIKNVLTICLVGLLSVQGWGQATAIYTVTATSTANQTGTKPTGAGHSYSQTFGTFKQITSGNSATLTLTGYAGYRITSIVLSMRSNASGGAGNMSTVAGSTTISSIATNTFSNAAWNGAYSTTAVNITKTPTAYDITSGQNVVITISATANSLYIESYSITYVPSGKTVIFDANGGTGTMANQTASVATNLTTNAFTRSGYAFAGWNTIAGGGGTAYANGALYPFTADATLYAQWTASGTPTLSASALTAFGTQCVGSTYGPNSFTITGTTLTTANVTVAALSGYTYSTSAGGTYTSSLSLSQGGGSYSQDIYVKFTPASAIAYSGNIVVGGGGATGINVAASGTGDNGTVAVTTVTASSITTTSASSGGNTLSTTCGTITVKGVVWATTPNPTISSNLGITSDGTGTGSYTSSITSLSAGTTYNYRAYATNSNGVTSYGTNLTFVTLKAEPTNQPTTFACGTTTTTTIPLSWTDATGAVTPDGYLIKWSATSYAAITAPTDGTTEANGTTTQNIAQGVGTYTATGLTSTTTYYFKIWSYTNSGSGIDYKITSVPQTSCATISGPCLSENFNAGTNPSGWINSTTGITFTSNYADISANTGFVTMVAVANPSSMTFDLSRTTNTTAKNLDIEVSTTSQSSGFSVVTNYDHSNTTSGGTTACTVNLSAYSGNGTVYIRFNKTSGSTSPWRIDNIEVFCSNAPEIDIKGNNVSITSGSTSPTTSNHTDFGSTAVAGGTVVRTFKIKNTGSDTLKLTGSSPFVTLSGADAADFSVTTTPASMILAVDSTSFQITFDPSAAGVRNAAISIANNDSDENPYTFNIRGTGTNSNLSDIIEGGTTYTSNHDYTLYQATPISTTANSVGVFKFTIRDGGVTASDADAFGTELNAITFNVTNIANIRSAALFGGTTQTTLIANTPSINTGTGKITFTGLSGANVRAADNGSKDLTLRVSYLTTVTDNAQLQYSIDTATANPDSSIFAAVNAGGATSSVSGNINRIVVTATKLRFVQQPTSTSVNTAMTPSVTIEAVDANNNRDLDFVGSVAITSTGTLTGSPVSATAASGVATFSGLTHTVTGPGLTLSATSTGLTGVTSSNFDITIFVFFTGDYRSASGGTWLNSGSTSTWDRYGIPSPGWNLGVTRPSTSTSDRVFIYHSIDATAIGPKKVIVRDGGYLTIKTSSSVLDSLIVETGGALQVDANLTVGDASSPDLFQVDSAGTVIVNFAHSNPSTSIWKGTEKFHPKSDLYIWDWKVTGASNTPLMDNDVSTNNYNSYTAAFGNIYVDLAGGTVADHWEMLGNSFGTNNLCHGNLTFLSPNGFDARFIATAGVTAVVGIQGNIKLNSGWSSARTFVLGTTTANLTVNVKGNLEMDCPGDFTVRASNSGGGGVTLNVDGNILMNGSNTTTNTNFKLNQNSYGTANGRMAIVNLKGNLTVGANPTIINLGAIDDQQFNFTGSTTQLVNVASAIGTGGTAGVPMYVKTGAYVQLNTNNLTLNNSSTFTVEGGGTLDFNWNASNVPLLIANGGSGSNLFTSAQSSTLKITHQNGLVKNTANDGNVQLSVSNKTFNQVATFHYIGKANQVTGNGITSGSSAKVIICDLIDNNTQLSFTNSTSITNTNTISASGGKLDIRKGQVIEDTSAYITGSTGTLYMSPGTLYQIAKGNSNASLSAKDLIPRLEGAGASFPYNLLGGTIELAGSGASEAFQTLRGGKTYKNIKYSGANTYLTDYKNLSSGVTIDSSLIISGTAVVDCIDSSLIAATFSGTGGFVMDGGRIRFRKLNTAQPELTATATSPARSYNITGGTVEFYNSGASQNQVLRGTDGNGNTITYNNIDINATAANSQSGASFYNVSPSASFIVRSGGAVNVNSPSVFRLDETENISGAGNFVLSAGATLLYGATLGITTSVGAATSTIGNLGLSGTRTLPTTASYGFVGSGAMVTGNALPTAMLNMYINKGASGDSVTLTNSAEVKGVIHFKSSGRIVTNSNLLYASDTSIRAIIGAASSGKDNFVQGNLQRKIASDSTYIFPVGLDTLGAQPFTITPTGTSGSTILGYMETNNTSPVKTVAYCDLETKTAPGQQVGQGTAGADGALDQVTFNLASPLQWDVTSPSGGVSSYNISVGANGGQDISPVTSAGGTAIRYLMKNGEPGNTGFATGSGGSDFPTVGFIACPNGYSLSGMTSFSKFTLDGASASNTALPVKLTYFTAKRVENRSQLDWATSLEIDNDRFEVERSADAVSFELMGTVKGAGNTTAPQTYRLIDEAPLQGWNYYRLKQIDFDGKFEYSQTVALYFDGENFSIVLYPNPAKGQFTLESFGEAKIFDAAIFNMLGQEIRKVNTGEVNRVNDLAAGNYFIKIKADNQIITKKLIIQ